MTEDSTFLLNEEGRYSANPDFVELETIVKSLIKKYGVIKIHLWIRILDAWQKDL